MFLILLVRQRENSEVEKVLDLGIPRNFFRSDLLQKFFAPISKIDRLLMSNNRTTSNFNISCKMMILLSCNTSKLYIW